MALIFVSIPGPTLVLLYSYSIKHVSKMYICTGYKQLIELMIEFGKSSKLCPAAAAAAVASVVSNSRPHRQQPTRLPVPGILQARTLEWVAISFSNAWNWKVKGKSLSRVRLFATPWTAAYQAPPSMDFPGKSTGVGCYCLRRKNCLEGIKLTIIFGPEI